MQIAQSCVTCGNKDLITSPAVLMPFISHRVFNWKPQKINRHWKLNSINEGNAYNICNSLLCKKCKLLFLDMRFDKNELGRLYKDYRGESYSKTRNMYEGNYDKRTNFLRKKLPHFKKIETFISKYKSNFHSILDWGGGNGRNTPFIKNNNAEIYIYDISNENTIEGTRKILFKEIYKKSFDLIICSHVLEHVPYPLKILKNIYKAMNENTFLYLEMPFEKIMHIKDNFELLDNKKHWHEHINFFSKNSINAMLIKSNLKIISFKMLKTIDDMTERHVFQVLAKKNK